MFKDIFWSTLKELNECWGHEQFHGNCQIGLDLKSIVYIPAMDIENTKTLKNTFIFFLKRKQNLLP